MYGDTNKNFRHGIPKTETQVSRRIGLTFRNFD